MFSTAMPADVRWPSTRLSVFRKSIVNRTIRG